MVEVAGLAIDSLSFGRTVFKKFNFFWGEKDTTPPQGLEKWLYRPLNFKKWTSRSLFDYNIL